MRKIVHEMLRRLRLRGMAEALDAELDRAEREDTAYDKLLSRLLRQEYGYRQERSLAYRISKAKIPWDWTLKSFPFEKQPGVNKAQIQALAELKFIERMENIVFIGNPGTGKTGLAIRLLRKALVAGYRGRFYNAQDLLDELYASMADRSTPKLLRRLSRYDILQIDEVGYLTLRPEQVNAFFKLMGERYGKKSTIITTNLLCSALHKRFNAEFIVMRSPWFASPANLSVRCILTPHKRVLPQRCDQFVGGLETSRAQFRRDNRF